MSKQSVNRRLREELSPERYGRSASPTSSASSREQSTRTHRRRSRSPHGHQRGGKETWGEDSRRGYGKRDRHASNHHHDSRYAASNERSFKKSDDDYDRKRSGPYARDDYPVKRARQDIKPHYQPGSEHASGYDEENGTTEYNNGKSSAKHPSQKVHHSADRPTSSGKQDTPRSSLKFSEAEFTDTSANALSGAANGDVERSPSGALGRSNRRTNGSFYETPPEQSNEQSGETGPVELSAEERRKRREALRAKLKNQSPDLRMQALQHRAVPASRPDSPKSPIEKQGDDAADVVSPSTPTADSSSSHPSPKTPADVGSPQPVVVSNDAELANGHAPATAQDTAEEPSAADYDPTDDMREDSIRRGKHAQDDSMPAQEFDEKRAGEHQVPVPDVGPVKPSEHETSKDEPVEDDMFASDDDDDDMFAAQPAHKSVKPSASDKSSGKGKAIDTSMLGNWDDADGYYKPILGETLDGRYKVQSNLGKGMFSGVVRATDLQTSELKAIKIIRNNDSMVKAAQKEMHILEKLADADPDDKKHVVRLERSFTHRDHLCMVFENLSLNLREVLKKFGRDIGINIKAIRSYAQQMFLALGLMRKCGIYHADLKPDNILATEDRASLKVCDLGSAGDTSEFVIAPYLVSRFYRAPEIILGCPYDFAIDMWSIGCTLFELFTGKILFTGRDNNGMLRNIMETRGKISVKMLKKAEFGAVHFDDANLYFRSKERDKVTGGEVIKLLNFQKPTPGRELKDRILAAAPKGIKETERKELLSFADLLDKCLLLNPERRITPTEALKHPFIYRT